MPYWPTKKMVSLTITLFFILSGCNRVTEIGMKAGDTDDTNTAVSSFSDDAPDLDAMHDSNADTTQTDANTETDEVVDTIGIPETDSTAILNDTASTAALSAAVCDPCRLSDPPDNCAPFCGDRHVDDGEQCDDGNFRNGDGCNTACEIEPGWYACNGHTDVCFQSTVCGDGVVWRNEECDDGNFENGDGCDAFCRIEKGATCEDDFATCTPDPCGNGIVNGYPGECDDGNALSNDGCSSSCEVEVGWICHTPNVPCVPESTFMTACGNGVVDQVHELCDNGVNDGAYNGCNGDCSLGPHCGDGLVWSGENPDSDESHPGDVELCDDGRNEGGYGRCAPGCIPGPYCGDITLDSPYEYWDDYPVPFTYRITCGPEDRRLFNFWCGDGILSPDSEMCDDGNIIDNDGCDNQCRCTMP